MELKFITSNDKEWQKAIEYIQNCPWKAGKSLASKMINNYFNDWQRVLIVLKDNNIIAFCTFTKEDCIKDVNYRPFIGYIYVDGKYRGYRLSKKMIDKAIDYASSLGFTAVYIVSDHVSLYEKYGFKICDYKENRHGKIEKIYQKKI